MRALQFVGTIVFARYCEAIRLHHPAVSELVAHLCSLSQTDDFPEWESRLMCLDVHGMGDLPPPNIIRDLPYEVGGEFHCAVEYLVEITMSIGYGSITDQPILFFQKLTAITDIHGVAVPELSTFVLDGTHDGFGIPIDDDLFRQWSSLLPPPCPPT